jgi:hypothetical protein
MREAPWKVLVPELKNAGYESPDLREAVGIRRDGALESVYPIPGPVVGRSHQRER